MSISNILLRPEVRKEQAGWCQGIYPRIRALCISGPMIHAGIVLERKRKTIAEFHYGQLAKRFCRPIADPSSSRSLLLCCGFVLAN